MTKFHITVLVLFIFSSCNKEKDNELRAGESYMFEANLEYDFSMETHSKSYVLDNCLMTGIMENKLEFLRQSINEFTGGYQEMKFQLGRVDEDSIEYFSESSFFNSDSTYLNGKVLIGNSQNEISGSISARIVHYYVIDAGPGSYPAETKLWANGSFSFKSE